MEFGSIDDLKRLLQGLEGKGTGGDSDPEQRPVPEQIDALFDYRQSYDQRPWFKPGDLVQVRAGEKKYRWPKFGQPAIVLKVWDYPERVDKPSDLEDMLIGVEIGGKVLPFTVDSAWFEKFGSGDGPKEESS